MSDKTESPALLSPERRTQLIKRVCLAPHIANTDIDAINRAFDAQEQQAAFRQQVATELAELLSVAAERDRNYDGVSPDEISAAATRLGLDLNPQP